MKLIHKPTGQEISVGSRFQWDDFLLTVNHCPPPHKPSSEGKMSVTYPSGAQSTIYYCSVFDCEWIDREDRQEETLPQPALPAGEDKSSLPCVRTADQITIEQIALTQQTIEKLKNKLDAIFDLIEGYIDGAKDSSEMSKLACQIEQVILS